MREGKKQLARDLLEKALECVKRIQLERYHKAAPADKESIVLDPKSVLYLAVENSKPVLQLATIRRSGTNYQVIEQDVTTVRSFV